MLHYILCHGKLTYAEAKQGLLTSIPGWKISAAYQMFDKFLFSVAPQNKKNNDYVLGGFYTVDCITGEINGYSPVMNPEEFRHALSNPILDSLQ